MHWCTIWVTLAFIGAVTLLFFHVGGSWFTHVFPTPIDPTLGVSNHLKCLRSTVTYHDFGLAIRPYAVPSTRASLRSLPDTVHFLDFQ